jgi:hypothetical protein
LIFNATFSNIIAISWLSILLVEDTGVSVENHRPVGSHWQTLSHTIIHKHHKTNHPIQRKCKMRPNLIWSKINLSEIQALEYRTTWEIYSLVGFMIFNATFSNIIAISWLSILLVEDTGVSVENHRPVGSHWQTIFRLAFRESTPNNGLIRNKRQVNYCLHKFLESFKFIEFL